MFQSKKADSARGAAMVMAPPMQKEAGSTARQPALAVLDAGWIGLPSSSSWLTRVGGRRLRGAARAVSATSWAADIGHVGAVHEF